ncbi:hypothetical protein HZ994_05395 [Akkermansiaceae bacterium]|nr:hypothetical protein HZ994_05395 [Akkermansiaceae bacterium]
MNRLIAFSLLLASLASAQETLFRQVADTKTDTHVEATALFAHPSLGGYHPVRILIANNQRVPHTVRLDFSDSTNYNNGLSTSSTFSFTAPPGRTVTSDILVPLAPQNGIVNYSNMSCRLSGTMGNTQSTLSSPFSVDFPCVLLSNSLYTPNASSLDSEVSSRGGHSRFGGSSDFATKFDPKRLPDDWRAFSGFDTIMLTDSDWSEIPPGPRNAITSWLRLGGHLVIHSSSNPTLSALGIPDDASFGKAQVRPIAPSLTLNPKQTVDLATSGRVAKTRMQSVANDFDGSWPLQDAFGEKSFNYILFIVILLAFGILVGPVNLFVFAKSGQRHRLFVTTPIISVATSLILIALIILQDGFGGDGTRLVLMEVRPDGNQNAAYVQQEQFSRTGVMTSPSFSVDASALMVPVPIASNRWSRFTSGYDASGSYDIQPSGGKLFASGGWFQSRSEQGQLITAVVPTRGRIESTPQPDTLISTFDFPIQTLLYKDASGQWHRAENVIKGNRVKLIPVDPTMAMPLLRKNRNLFTERNRSYLERIEDRNDHFIAFTDKAPAIDTHAGIVWKTTTIITGPIAR